VNLVNGLSTSTFQNSKKVEEEIGEAFTKFTKTGIEHE